MQEIFKFTQLRTPTGINEEEVRLKHIPFFKYIENVQSAPLAKTFIDNGFEKGLVETDKHLKSKSFLEVADIPRALISKEWKTPLKANHKVYFELSYLLSQLNSDRNKDSNVSLFEQINASLETLANQDVKAGMKELEVYFPDLLALYFRSGQYPSLLRLLIGLRRWHFVLSSFTVAQIINDLKQQTDKKILELAPLFIESTPLYFLFDSKILLPKYLFRKAEVVTPKPLDKDNTVTPRKDIKVTPDKNIKVTPEKDIRVTPDKDIRVTPEKDIRVTPDKDIKVTPEKDIKGPNPPKR